ncbi:MAG: hypothetical protein ACREMH_05570 [Gemmatimonadales bacterium]
MPSPKVRAGVILAAALAVGSCSHEEPADPGTTGPSGPQSPDLPTRLTFSSGYDLSPNWLPDGSGILHSYDRRLDGRFDRCLGQLPRAGGSRTVEFCAATEGSLDSLDALEGAGQSPDGLVLYQWSQSREGEALPRRAALVSAPAARLWETTTLTPVPYLLPGGRPHQLVGPVQWFAAGRAVYLGQDVLRPRPCQGCPPDTIPVGREVVLVTFSAGTATLSIIPGTEDATSVAADPAGDAIYFTKLLDTRVFHLGLAGGTPEEVFDFGSAGIARDVTVRGRKLLAVVGGVVFAVSDPALGVWQEDAGGPMLSLDLDSQVVQPVGSTGSYYFRHPSLSPDGVVVAVEAYLRVQPEGVLPIPDLWLYPVP